MSDLIDTTEMYLKTIFELEEEGIVPLRARIAERLHQSGPTVSQTVARMERDGLLHVDADRHLELTDHGRLLATRVMRKHRLVERLLVDVIGLDWPLVHNEACRWEHVVSEAVERRLVDLLDRPATDPYGNPIPGLSELVRELPADDGRADIRLLTDVSTPAGVEVTLRHIGEPLQVDEKLLAGLRDAAIVPGRPVVASRTDTGVRLRATGSDALGRPVDLTHDDAAHVFVSLV